MLIHKECGGQVSAYLGEQLITTGEIAASADKREIVATSVRLILKQRVTNNPRFYCIKCFDIVSLSNVNCTCRDCGETKELNELQVPLDSGGVYCSSCIERFNDEQLIPFNTILNRPLRIK